MAKGQGLLIIERILRDRDGIWRQVVEERSLKDLTTQMLISSAVSLALYGLVLGAHHGFAQALSSAIKLPLLFLATLAICLPTLYLFNLLFGARLSMLQAVALIMVSITVTAVVALAFAPISLFFLISAHNYPFFKLLNVAILMLAAVVGLRFLTSGMQTLNAYQHRVAAGVSSTEAVEEQPALAMAAATQAGTALGDGSGATGIGTAVATLPQAPALLVPHQGVRALPPTRPASMTLLYIWIALFGFVGTQLAWTLRPFFGSPGQDFALFRNIEGTFYTDIFATIGRLFGG